MRVSWLGLLAVCYFISTVSFLTFSKTAIFIYINIDVITFLFHYQAEAEKTCKEFIDESTARTLQAFFDCKKEMTFKSEEDKLSKMNVRFQI